LKEISVYHKIRHTYDTSRSAIWREICRYLKRYIPEDSTVLDLGAGYGDFLLHTCAENKYGLELNKVLIQHWPDDIEPILQSASDPFPLTMKLRIPKWRWLIQLYLALPFKLFAGQFLIVAERPSDV
jgi:hypothetical protein